MNTVTPSPVEAVEPAVPRPLLGLDTTILRLSSPRGDAARAALTITNNGDATLRGTATARVGETWLRVTPATLDVPPHESLQLAVSTETADLPTGYLRGEIAVTSNGGAATVSVRFGVRAGRVWRVFAIAVAAVAIATLLVGVALARVNVVAPPLSLPTLPSFNAGSHGNGIGLPPLPGIRGRTLSASARAAALVDIQQSVKTSNSVWLSALTLPSPSALASVESGDELQTTTAEVNGLATASERWRIAQSAFAVQPHSVTVSDDGATGAAIAVKTERRALYDTGVHAGTPYDSLDATYRLRYSLVHQNGRWLVDRVTVESVTPHTPARPFTSVQDVARGVLPVVMRIEADSTGQTAVGTGIVVRSSATGSDILTNDHVVTGASGNVNVEHRTDGGTDGPWHASRVSEDPADDLAVIHIDHGNLPVAAWGDPAALTSYAQVVAIGYAEDLPGGPTVTSGTVSSLARPVSNGSSDTTYIQHSATINHGNSGGPLVDMSGRVVGVNTLSLDNTQGLFFAIPFTRAAPIIANDTGSNG